MGFMTKQLVNKLSDTIAPRLISRFCSAVRNFYTTAVTYMIKNFPLDHQILKHAKFVNYEAALQWDVTSAEFFINRYQNFFGNFNLGYLHDEFLAYKTLADLPPAVVKLAMVTQTKGQHFLWMDVIWDHLSKLKDLSGNFKYPLFSKVPKLVWTIPSQQCRFWACVQYDKQEQSKDQGRSCNGKDPVVHGDLQSQPILWRAVLWIQTQQGNVTEGQEINLGVQQSPYDSSASWLSHPTLVN